MTEKKIIFLHKQPEALKEITDLIISKGYQAIYVETIEKLKLWFDENNLFAVIITEDAAKGFGSEELVDFIKQYHEISFIFITKSGFDAKNFTNNGYFQIHKRYLNTDLLKVLNIIETKLQNNKKLKWISETTTQLLLLSEHADIFSFIGNSIHQLLNPSVLIVSSYDPHYKEFRVEYFKQDGVINNTSFKDNLNNHNSIQYKISESKHQELLNVKFVQNSLTDFIKEDNSEFSNYIKSAQNSHNCFTFGLTNGLELFGLITIMSKENNTLQDYDLLKTFFNQSILKLINIQSKKSLLNSEVRLQRIFENDGTAIGQADEFGNIYRVNKKFEEIFGYNSEELKSLTFKDLIHPDDYEMLLGLQSFQHLGNKKSDKNGIRVIHKNGSIKNIEMLNSGTATEDDKTQGYCFNLLDNTENQKLENEFSKSTEQYHNFFENALIGIFRTQISDGKLLMANEKVAKLLGWTSIKDMIDNKVRLSEKYVNIEDRKKLLDTLSEHGQVAGFEVQLYNTQKEIWWAKLCCKIYHEHGYIEGTVDDITEIKIAQEKIHQSNELYRTVAESPIISTLLLDKDLKILKTNRAFCNLSGYSSKEFASMGCLDFYAQKEKEKILKLIYNNHNGNRAKIETVLTKKDGKLVNIIFSLSPFFDEEKNITGYLAIIIDINDLKETREKLANEQAYFKELFDHSPEALIITSNEGKIVNVNQEFTTVFGYSYKEVIGEHVDTILAPEKFLSEAIGITSKVLSGTLVSTETLRKHKNGSYIDVSVLGAPVFANGKQIGVYGIYRDITNQKNAERELHKSKMFIESVFHNAQDGICVLNMDGDFVEVNQAMSQITGFQKEKIIGSNINQLLPKSWHKQNELAFSFLKSGKSWGNFETEFIVENNQIVPVLITYSVISDENGKPHSIISTVKDIVDIKLLQQKLKEEKEKAEKADKQKSVFLSNMSHEIRTPMNTILGFSDILLEPDLTEEEKNEFINLIRNSGNTLLTLIDDIIDISKIEAGRIRIKKENCNIFGLLTDLHMIFEEDLRTKGKKDVDLILKTPNDFSSFVVFTDPNRLRQIITNLLTNAIKFTESGRIEFGYRFSSSNNIVFFCSDTGIGIPEDMHETIFERFGQVDSNQTRKVKGTGLGLAICKNLVELLGGNIRVESEPDNGTTFTFTLPLQLLTDVISSSTVLPSGKKWDGKTILIAEDNKSNYMLIEAYLQKSGVTIMSATNGIEAIRLATQYQNIDLVLMDIQMPEMDGCTALDELRKLGKTMPVIAQTAYAMNEDRDKFLDMGFSGFIPKPVSSKVLFDLLNKFLA